MTPSNPGHGIAQRLVAWREVRHQRQRSDPHDVIGGERRQHVVRIDVSEATDGDRVGGVQVHHRPRLVPAVQRQVQESYLGRLVAIDPLAPVVETGEPRRVEFAESDSGGRHQPAAVGQPGADVAGAAEREAALEERAAVAADILAQSNLLAQDSISRALVKKSSEPKLPDFSASARSGPATERVQGTPGSISWPMASCLDRKSTRLNSSH